MRTCVLVVAIVVGMTAPVLAQETPGATAGDGNAAPLMVFAAAEPDQVTQYGAPRLARPIAEAAENEVLKKGKPGRPGALLGMYSTLSVLNVIDVYSTIQAVENGAREANPLLSRAAGSAGASLAIKAATTATSIYFAERLWKKNSAAALITMVAINAGTAAVVARNLRNARMY